MEQRGWRYFQSFLVAFFLSLDPITTKPEKKNKTSETQYACITEQLKTRLAYNNSFVLYLNINKTRPNLVFGGPDLLMTRDFFWLFLEIKIRFDSS